MTDLVIIATLELRPGSREQVIPVLQRHRECCLRDEPGTLAFEVLVPEKLQDQILLYERYTSREAFDAHWNGSSMKAVQAEAGSLIINLVGTFCTPTE